MHNRRFDNPKMAEFEAYMTDSYALKDLESGWFKLSTLSEVKEEIKSLIAKGEYEVAREISERLSKPVEFTLEERPRPLRVRFPVYVRLVYEAVTEQIALTDAVKRRVVRDLQSAIKMLSAREDINGEKLALLSREISAWSEEQVEKRKSYSKTKRKGGEPSVQNPEPDAASGEEFREDYYRPYYLLCGDPPVEALRQLLIESEVEEHSNILPPEVLRELFGAAETELETSADNEIPEYFDLVIRKAGDEGLKIEFGYSGSFVTEESWVDLDKRFPAFDDETMEKIRGLTELADTEPFCHSTESQIILSASLKVDDHGVYIEGLPVTEDESVLTIGLLDRLAPISDEDRIKAHVSEALQKNDLNRVAELTRELQRKKEKRERISFALKTILYVAKRSQVVSFRAPDVLIRAWEAYGDVTLESGRENQ